MVQNIRLNRLLPLLPIYVVCISALLSCGKSVEDTTDYNKQYPTEAGGTLIDASTAEPSGLISMVAGESASSAISSHIFNSLLKYDKNLDLEGELVENWQISSDHKTITFKLKPNLKWADGKPLTSADVLFTWKLVTDEKNPQSIRIRLSTR